MATCKDCLHSFVCWKSMQVEKDNLPCSDFADRSLYVVREKGEWIPIEETMWERPVIVGWECSKCGEQRICERNFCPNCGADMRIEEQNRAREVKNG